MRLKLMAVIAFLSLFGHHPAVSLRSGPTLTFDDHDR
jgi:hypothetical protein